MSRDASRWGMLRSLPWKIFAALVAACLMAFALGLLWPDDMESTAAALVLAAPLLTVYALHAIGIPGLLEHDGLCGWGWCEPTWIGWCAALLVWLSIGWLLALGLAALVGRRRTEDLP